MEKETIKIIVCIVLFLVFGGLVALFALVDLDLSIVEFSSINGVIAKREELLRLEQELQSTEMKYEQAKKSLTSSQSSFSSAKNKYEAISDETINLIKEATTEENYDIEYMWIRLGNYALTNNLSISMVEPGGITTSTNSNTDTQPANAQVDNTQTTAADTTSTAEVPNSSTTTSTNSDTLLTIVVEGSYLNMSDFVFEVENDKELRFKLDNIEITYVSGTTIKAKFDVKNVIILK